MSSMTIKALLPSPRYTCHDMMYSVLRNIRNLLTNCIFCSKICECIELMTQSTPSKRCNSVFIKCKWTHTHTQICRWLLSLSAVPQVREMRVTKTLNWWSLVNNQLDAQFFFLYLFIPILYMFRATKCSSSGESVVSIGAVVYVIVCRWLCGMRVWPAYRTVHQVGCLQKIVKMRGQQT